MPGLLLAALLLATPASARTIYVSKTGNDANSGTASSPYATVQKAFYVAADGDAILVNAGDYAASLNTSKRVTVSSWSGVARIVGINNQAPQVDAGPD